MIKDLNKHIETILNEVSTASKDPVQDDQQFSTNIAVGDVTVEDVTQSPNVDPELPKMNRHQRRRMEAIVRKLTKENMRKSVRKPKKSK